MSYTIKNPATLKKWLWLDFILGFSSGLAGTFFTEIFSSISGLSITLITGISIITLMYAIFAFIQAVRKSINIKQLIVLVYANWIWTIISVFISFFHYSQATGLGKIYLLAQIALVGLLAWQEGNQLRKI